MNAFNLRLLTFGASTFHTTIFNTLKLNYFPERGCPAAALRVWPWKTTEKTPIELCGDTLDTYKQILSETNVLQMSFYLADKAVGAKGFKATWTEIKVKEK